MKNSDYWKRRFEILEQQTARNAGKFTATVENQIIAAHRTIDEQIEQWYGRFAKNNQITLTEARQWLTGKDLAEFQWDVNEYIKYGKDVSLDPAYIRQLENASARFHVSRLEALKIRTQNTLEHLYGNFGQQSSSVFGRIYTDNYYHTAFELQKGFNVGWNIAAVSERQVQNVLNKPWTLDKETFSDRIWTQKQDLVNEVHRQLTQNLLLGRPPDAAIKAIAEKFGTINADGKRTGAIHNAGRLVMTESVYFASEAQKGAFNELDVEEFEIVATLDNETSAICRDMDGKHFPMTQFEPGLTAPPFHPWCRSVTVPFFEDLGGGRFARDEETGKAYYVPSDMKYPEWKEKFVDDGDKSRLHAIDRDGVVEWSRVQALNNEEKSSKINMGILEQSIGAIHVEKMVEILEQAPANIQSVWNKYADELKVVTTTSRRGDFCNRQGVSINLE